MRAIIVIMGESGSGKDTSFGLIRDTLAFSGLLASNVKFTRNPGIKDTLEQLYELPSGSLDRQEVKDTLVPGNPLGYTYGEVLVKTWELLPQVDPTLYVRLKEKQVRSLLDLECIPVFTDCRATPEVSLIHSLASDYAAKLVVIRLKSPYATVKASDQGCDSLTAQLRTFPGSQSFQVVNDKSIYDLQYQLNDLLRVAFPEVSWDLQLDRDRAGTPQAATA